MLLTKERELLLRVQTHTPRGRSGRQVRPEVVRVIEKGRAKTLTRHDPVEGIDYFRDDRY